MGILVWQIHLLWAGFQELALQHSLEEGGP